MLMKKAVSTKIMSLIVSGCFLVGLIGCGSTNLSDSSETHPESERIIMTFLTTGNTPTDIEEVQTLVNEISLAEINVEVEFKPVSMSDSYSQYSLWISGGDQIDLMMVAFQGLNPYISSGQIVPLNELVAEFAPYIATSGQQFPIFDGSNIDGDIYGIQPIDLAYGNLGAMFIREDLLEETGIEIEEVNDFEKLTEIFSAIKVNYPEMAPYGVIASNINANRSNFGFFHNYDVLGATIQSGVLMDLDSTEIVNLFETDAYYQYLKQVREWYEAGFILSDAATTHDLPVDLYINNRIAGGPMRNLPDMIGNYERDFGFPFTAIQMTEPAYVSIAPSSASYWTIPTTSANPEAAIKFLNLMYENKELANLIKNGVEGKHYIMTEHEGIITYPDGVDVATTGFSNSFGLYGDQRAHYTWAPSDPNRLQIAEEFNQKTLNNKSVAAGYTYNPANMINQLGAITVVLNQYLPALETGSVDPESVYDEFISQLKAAGIDEVIADNQAQFDAWLEEQ